MNRERAELSIRVDNFDLYRTTLKTSATDCVFRNEQFVLVGDLGVGGDYRGTIKYLIRLK